MEHQSNNYVIEVLDSAARVEAMAWNSLLAEQSQPNPFMRHEYLLALQTSDSACEQTGWTPRFIVLQRDGLLVGACALYVKSHSYGEYVFDWSWANAYHQHGLPYYPKALVAVPFTPVPGSRLMAKNSTDRAMLIKGLIQWCDAEHLSSLHVLFACDEDLIACEAAGMMLRHTVQFHWSNTTPGYASFDDFLASLTQDKRKKIRQERRKVIHAGVQFRWSQGASISAQDWEFFYRCYERTYLEHGNTPYLSREFFQQISLAMPQNWLMFIGERAGQPIAASLIAVTSGGASQPEAVAYGRYWGALERVDCLHFEACYYQPLQWCIDHGYQRFEGGAQGEHKMARALLPVKTSSAHWMAHPEFGQAVTRFLEREGEGVDHYLKELQSRSPLRP